MKHDSIIQLPVEAHELVLELERITENYSKRAEDIQDAAMAKMLALKGEHDEEVSLILNQLAQTIGLPDGKTLAKYYQIDPAFIRDQGVAYAQPKGEEEEQ